MSKNAFGVTVTVVGVLATGVSQVSSSVRCHAVLHITRQKIETSAVKRWPTLVSVCGILELPHQLSVNNVEVFLDAANINK